jgi:transposase
LLCWEPNQHGPTNQANRVSEEERSKLQEWARRPRTAQRLSMRARVVLGCADGMENRQVARQLRIADQTVCKWRERFRVSGLEGLADEPRPGTPRKISDAQVEALITRTLESTPRQGTHWSTRTMAEATRMSQSTISRIWRAFSLQPHRVETFKLSTDPFFIEKVRDTVGLYRNAPWCCVWTRKTKSRHSIAHVLYCRYGRVCRHAKLTITSATEPLLCSLLWTWPQVSDWLLPPSSPASGVPTFPGTNRRSCSRSTRYSLGDG